MSITRLRTLSVRKTCCVLCQFRKLSSIHQQKSLKKRRNKQEAIEDTVFQYAGKQTKRTDRCFVWGYAATGALGAGYMLEPNNPKEMPRKKQLYPHHLKVFGHRNQEVTGAGCGYGFTVFAVKGDKKESLLYGTGINTESQIGFHFKTENKPFEYLITPLPIAVPLVQPATTKYTHVDCGRAHTIVVTDNEGVFSLGNNAHGQCCRPIIEDEIYTGSQLIHKVSFHEQVAQVVCGQDSTIIVTSGGEVYSCGLGADGQTGLGHFEATGKLSKVKGDIEGVKIKQVSCKADCVLAVSEEGDVYGWGNTEYNQLDSVAGGATQVPSPVRLPFSNLVGRVHKVAAGGSTCALVNEDGDVYVWGYGILGKGPNVLGSAIPSKIPETIFGRTVVNPSVKVIDVQAGMNFFLAQTNYGDLFSWGRNKTAALGLGHLDDQFFPFKVQVPADVKQVCCGVDHVVVKAKTFA